MPATPSSSSLASCQPVFELLPSRRRSHRLSVDPLVGGPRKAHIRRLFDLLHLSKQRGDQQRSRRIWSILVRCREVDFSSLWDLGLSLLAFDRPILGTDDEDDSCLSLDKRLAYLKACQNLCTEESSRVLIEYVCVLIAVGRLRDALEEVELYLPVQPHSQHAGLHEYAGMLALAIAKPDSTLDEYGQLPGEPRTITEYLCNISTSSYHGKAKAYFERAQLLNPHSVLSTGYLHIMQSPAEMPEYELD